MLLRDDFFADLARIAIRNPIQLRHQLRGADIRRRIVMALQAKRHVQRFFLVNLYHLIDPSVTAHATDSGRHVRLVIEENKIR